MDIEEVRNGRDQEVGRNKEERGKSIASTDQGGTSQICKCGEGINDRWTDHRDKEGMSEGRDGSQRRVNSRSVC